MSCRMDPHNLQRRQNSARPLVLFKRDRQSSQRSGSGCKSSSGCFCSQRSTRPEQSASRAVSESTDTSRSGGLKRKLEWEHAMNHCSFPLSNPIVTSNVAVRIRARPSIDDLRRCSKGSNRSVLGNRRSTRQHFIRCDLMPSTYS